MKQDISVYVNRKTDGALGRLDLEADSDEDLWTAIGRVFPGAYEDMDESMILAVDEGQYDRDLDEIFNEDEDEELCSWLHEWTAAAVELGTRKGGLIGEAVGYSTREEAVRRAEDIADDWINRQACDLAELVVVVEVGGEDVRRFEDGQWEDVE